MNVVVASETPLQDDVRRLVSELNAYLKPLSPEEFQFQMNVEEMARDDTHVFVARNAKNDAVGMGALKVHSNELGEVKRMYTDPQIRGTGTGRIILEAVESKARALRISRLVLETGSTTGFESAWRIYERCGYTICDAILDYPDSGYSRFFEKTLN